MKVSYKEHCNFLDRHYSAVEKAETTDNTTDFVKHCHSLIHMCSEAISKNMPEEAEFVYYDLSNLIKKTTVEF